MSRVVLERRDSRGADGAPPRPWLPLLLPLLAGAAALTVSWQRWINPFIDSGREMDVPWRLLQGERLYHDITYYYGPLGPWLNALALRLFGHHWAVLQAVCLALSAAIFALLYRLTREAGSRLAAIAATTLAAALCMGAPRGGAFIFPYSSSGLVGLAGGLLALWLACLPRRGLYLAAAAAGLAVALAARLEVGVAAAVALVIAGVRSGEGRREMLRWCLGVVAAAALAAGALYAVALRGVTWSEISHDGPLTHLVGMPPEWHHFYLDVAGLDRPVRDGIQVALSLALDAGLLALLGGFALPLVPGAPAARRRLLYPVAMLALLAAYLESLYADPRKNLPPLTLVLPLVTAVAAAALLRRPLAGQARARFLLFGFSAALAARVLLDLQLGPRMGPYATLPMPGILATAAVLAFDGLAPRLPNPAIFRRRLAALLAVVGALFLYRLERLDRQPTNQLVETPAGELRLPAQQAQALDATLRYVEQRARPGDRLTAFPESGFFNFVTGLRSPLRQDQVFPGVLLGEREIEVARQIERAGPRFILLCYRPTPEYGPVAFGVDYDVWLWHQIERRYALAAAYGGYRSAAPAGAWHYFIRVYERVPRPGEPRIAAEDSPAGRRFGAPAIEHPSARIAGMEER